MSSASHQSSARSARADVGIEAIDGAAEQTPRQRQIVALERAPAGGGEMARRALADGATLRVDRPELAQMLVRLLEVPAHRLVVLDAVGDPPSSQSAKRSCSSARVPLRCGGRRRRG